jgi:hypothetical protein
MFQRVVESMAIECGVLSSSRMQRKMAQLQQLMTAAASTDGGSADPSIAPSVEEPTASYLPSYDVLVTQFIRKAFNLASLEEATVLPR